jgi:hypothetical protein
VSLGKMNRRRLLLVQSKFPLRASLGCSCPEVEWWLGLFSSLCSFSYRATGRVRKQKEANGKPNFFLDLYRPCSLRSLGSVTHPFWVVQQCVGVWC